MYGKSTSIDNSIPQKTKTVKNDTAINKDMQNDKNNTNSIEKVTNVYDENKKRSISLPNGSETTPNNTSKTNRLSTSNAIIISENKDIIISIENFKNATNTINRDTIVDVANALNIYHKNNQTFIDKNMAMSSGNNINPKINKITEFFKDYKSKLELRKMAGTYALEEYKNKTVVIKDTNTKVDLSQKGLKKTFNIKQSNETLQTAPILPKIIKESIYVNSSIDLEDSNFIYHYFYSPVSVNRDNAISMITIKEIVTDKSKNPKFYYHDIREINNKELLHAIPQQKLSKMLFEETPNIDNSISQNTDSVKNDTAINNKSMQNEEKKYTQNQLNNITNNVYNQDNITQSLTKKETKIDKKIKEYIKNNPDLETDIDISIPKELLNVDSKSITQMEAYKIARNLFNEIHKRKFSNNNENIYTTNTDIKESINITYTYTAQRKLLKENIALYSYLDKIIENGVEISSENELKGRKKYQGWKYYVTPVNIDNQKYIVEFDTVKRENGERHFRVERLYKINKGNSATVVSTKELTTRFTAESPNVDNSIPQNTESVKNDTAINKHSMQKADNYAEQKQIQKELHDRIQNSLLSKNSKKNTYLGRVSKQVAKKVQTLLGIDISSRKHIISDRDIRHIINQHGNQTIEETKGQIAITTKDIEKIPDIINNYDEIAKGSQNKNRFTGEMQNSIRYIKQYNNDNLYVVEVVPDNSNQLNIKTMWKKPIDKNKIDNSVSVGYDNNKVLPDTSKTKPNSSYLNKSITQNMENVKNEDIRFAKRTAKSQNGNIDTTQRNAERQGAYIEQEIQKVEKTRNWDDSIPITKLTDIRKTIEDYLGLGVKKGHFREDAYAIYKGNRDVIRTKEFKDMDSILHETGHALDIGNRLKVDKESISTELLTAIDKLGGYESETRTIRLEEGFAEVIREYSIIPEQAKIDYPNTVSILEELRQNDKSFNKFITKVQRQTYNYIHQNPRNRTLSNISIGEQTDKAPLTKSWLKQEIMRNIYDKDYALKSAVNEIAKIGGKTANSIKASENAYLLTRLASGIGDKVTSMLADGYIDENGNRLMPGLNQIGEILENNPQRFDDFRANLIANRDVDYKSGTLKSGLRDMDTKNVREQFKNDTQIQEATKLVYDTLDGVMQYAVNNGLITQETADNLKESNAFYVPMQRVLENKGNQVGRRGAVSDIIKRRTGSELDIKDVLENIITNSSNVIQQVENNNILKAFYKEGEASGMTGVIYDVIDTPMTKVGTAKLSTWETELRKQGVDTASLDLEKTIDLFSPNNKVDSQNLITSFIDDNGKRIYLQFNDEILFNSLMNMDKKFMSQVLRINSKMNMPLRYGATMANIGFAIPNMISDTAQAAIYSTAGFIPVVDNALGVLDILATTNKTVGNFVNKVAPEYAKKINTLYTIYQQTGATSSTRLSQYRESSQSVMKDVYGTKKSENLGIKESFKPLKRLLDLMTYIPEISEQSTRFEVFKKNYDYYKNKGNSEMDARIMAALESRDATQDFGRTGNFTREINQLIPFSAARVGSIYTFAEKIKANPKQVGMRIAILTALAMAIKAIGYDDDEIEELNQRKKDDNFVFKVGNSVLTIKKPQGILRSMINLAEYIQDLATGHIEEGKEGDRLGEWINNAIMDNMPADSITGLVPNMVAPLIENAVNKDFYYNTNIVKSYDTELPNSEQYYDYNSQLAIWLGKIFNYSPAKIDNLISGYFGGLGTQVTDIMDYASGKLGIISEQPEMGAEDNAVGKRFFVNVNSNSASIDEIYNRKTELTKLKNGGTITEKETKELETITNAVSNLSKLNKQIKEIKKDLSMSGEEKAKQIKLLQQQRTDTARQVLGKDLIYSGSASKIQSTQFYPTSSSLSKNNYTLILSSEMRKEYEQLANEYYSKYAKQGIYTEDKLADIKSKAKDYAKNELFKKYKSDLVKSKK